MNWFKNRIPLLGFAIINYFFIENINDSSPLITSLLILFAGYIIGKLKNDAYEHPFLYFIITECIYYTLVTIVETNQIAFLFVAIMDFLSGYIVCYYDTADNNINDNSDDVWWMQTL